MGTRVHNSGSYRAGQRRSDMDGVKIYIRNGSIMNQRIIRMLHKKTVNAFHNTE